jgi:branched-chain amino acid transport system substrate-binding protein
MRIRALMVAVAALVTLAAAGCGSSSKSSSSNASSSSSSNASSSISGSSGTTAGASTNAPKGTAIPVGFECSCTGGQAAGLGASGLTAKAWADSVNAGGGINGHPVKLYSLDDGGVTSTALQNVKKLVEEDHVVAIVGTTSSVATVWASYVQSKGVPVIGGNPFLAPMAASSDFFPLGASVPVELVGINKLAKSSGTNHLGLVYCAETPVCATLGPLAKGIGALDGVTVSTGKASVAQPNFTALCLEMKQSGVGALAVAQSAPTVSRVHDSCVQQGFKPVPLNFASGASPLWLKDPNLNNRLLMVSEEANYQDSSIPQVNLFNAALAKYAPGLRGSDSFGLSGTWDTWLGGQLFAAAAKAANIGPSSTPADVKKGLYALKNETLQGAVAPLNYVQGKPTFLSCYFVIGVKNGQYTSPQGTAPFCLSKSEAAGLGKVLAG